MLNFETKASVIETILLVKAFTAMGLAAGWVTDHPVLGMIVGYTLLAALWCLSFLYSRSSENAKRAAQ